MTSYRSLEILSIPKLYVSQSMKLLRESFAESPRLIKFDCESFNFHVPKISNQK